MPAMTQEVPSKWWIAGLIGALVLGAALRLVWVEDMEYKYDECWMFWQTQGLYGQHDSPWLGNFASNGTRNPGMSTWVFLALGKIFRVTEPTDLTRAVEITNILALGLLAWFALRVVPREQREPWLWAIALVAVNPLTVAFHRKIWAPSILPLFTVLLLIGWWHRQRQSGAFLWAVVAVVMGQIHPTGHLLGLGMALWAFAFDRGGVAWKGWFAGSAVGALPMIPWLHHILTNADPAANLHRSWKHIAEGKFWIRWVTEPFGLGLDYSLFEDFPMFLQYPVVAGVPTYLVALLHVLVVAAMVFVLGRALYLLWRQRSRLAALWVGRSSDTAFTQSAILWGFGILLTLTCMPLHRHYMVILFPMEFLWLARLALAASPNADDACPAVFRPGRVVLGSLLALQLLLSVAFLGYIHSSGGSASGDYGIVYRLEKHFRSQAAENFSVPKQTVRLRH